MSKILKNSSFDPHWNTKVYIMKLLPSKCIFLNNTDRVRDRNKRRSLLYAAYVHVGPTHIHSHTLLYILTYIQEAVVTMSDSEDATQQWSPPKRLSPPSPAFDFDNHEETNKSKPEPTAIVNNGVVPKAAAAPKPGCLRKRRRPGSGLTATMMTLWVVTTTRRARAIHPRLMCAWLLGGLPRGLRQRIWKWMQSCWRRMTTARLSTWCWLLLLQNSHEKWRTQISVDEWAPWPSVSETYRQTGWGLHQRGWLNDACATPHLGPHHEPTWIWTDFLSEQRRATGLVETAVGRVATTARTTRRCSRKTQDKFAIVSWQRSFCTVAYAHMHERICIFCRECACL